MFGIENAFDNLLEKEIVKRYTDIFKSLNRKFFNRLKINIIRDYYILAKIFYFWK